MAATLAVEHRHRLAARHRSDPLPHHRGRRIRHGHRTVRSHAHLKGKQP
nr:MAG TPA: hypothetical protein [Caudoviricetes sp.]